MKAYVFSSSLVGWRPSLLGDAIAIRLLKVFFLKSVFSWLPTSTEGTLRPKQAASHAAWPLEVPGEELPRNVDEMISTTCVKLTHSYHLFWD